MIHFIQFYGIQEIIMQVRKYGTGPVKIVMVHGGPGASGEMGPVCRELSVESGILEPMQSALTVDGQVKELADILCSDSEPPVILVGYSWGAWLCSIVTARYPNLVNKLILISSRSFEEQYPKVWPIRLNRLTPDEQEEVKTLLQQMDDPACARRDDLLSLFGEYMKKTDSYRPTSLYSADEDHIPANHELHIRIWNEAAQLRRDGRLLDICRQIQCPVTAIHGDYDPHPAEGVREPLSSIIPVFKFILLENCGHCPWIEEEARDQFYTVLRAELCEHLDHCLVY